MNNKTELLIVIIIAAFAIVFMLFSTGALGDLTITGKAINICTPVSKDTDSSFFIKGTSTVSGCAAATVSDFCVSPCVVGEYVNSDLVYFNCTKGCVNGACLSSTDINPSLAAYCAERVTDTCTPTTEICNDGKDNDCDTKIDCNDPNCANNPRCIVQTCGDGDCDERNEDCETCPEDCGICPPVCDNTETLCNDGKDNDCDGSTDCEDTDCSNYFNCIVPTCFDQEKNLDETGVDCGGSCSPCYVDKGCNKVGDYCVTETTNEINEKKDTVEDIVDLDREIIINKNDKTNLRNLVILVHFTDNDELPFIPTPPFTAEQMQERIFNGNIKHFYDEVSYGKAEITGNVYGWFNVHGFGNTGFFASDDLFIKYSNEQSIAEKILSTVDNLEQYQYITFITTGNGCDGIWARPWAEYIIDDKVYNLGTSILCYDPSWDIQWEYHTFPYTWLDQAFVHEEGHSMGLGHSNSLECMNGKIIGDNNECTVMGYGNRYDPMGNARFAIHFSAWQKERLGWLTDADILNINKSGTYTINPLEYSSGYRGAKISVPNIGALYFLEYRTPVLLDRTLSDWPFNNANKGLFVHRSKQSCKWEEYYSLNYPSNLVYTSDMTEYLLLDMSPDVYDIGYPFTDWWDVTLNDGIFIDAEAGNLKIGPIIKTTENSITFSVTMPVIEHPEIKLEFDESALEGMSAKVKDKPLNIGTLSYTGSKGWNGYLIVRATDNPEATYPNRFNLPIQLIDPNGAVITLSYNFKLINSGIYQIVVQPIQDDFKEISINLQSRDQNYYCYGYKYHKIINVELGNPANNAPVISITKPLNNSVFTMGNNIAINVSAYDPDGSVSYVVAEYSTNGSIWNYVGVGTLSPYYFVWNNIPQGRYIIRATATDNQQTKSYAYTNVVINKINIDQ